MLNITTTKPKFGVVEAYAKRQRRVVPIIDTEVTLSLQTVEGATPSSAIKQLLDGSAFDLKVLSGIVPSLNGLTWGFRKASSGSAFELVTVADDIEVLLSAVAPSDSRFLTEGVLRGLAARIAVALDSDPSC